MTPPRSAASVDADEAGGTSRRTFLQLAAGSAGVGLGTASATATSRRSGEDVRVAVSPELSALASAAADSTSDGSPAGDVSLDVAETTAGADRLAAGDLDVLVGSRPLLPGERSRVADTVGPVERRDLPTAVAALRQPASVWLDCLSPASVAETWAGAGGVETWAEVTSGPAVGDVRSARRSERPSGQSPAGPVLVRGVRAHQYAEGYGGLGYYQPDADWLVGDPTPDDAATPLVRLASVYAPSEARDHGPVAAVVRALARRSEALVGDVRYRSSPLPDR